MRNLKGLKIRKPLDGRSDLDMPPRWVTVACAQAVQRLPLWKSPSVMLFTGIPIPPVFWGGDSTAAHFPQWRSKNPAPFSSQARQWVLRSWWDLGSGKKGWGSCAPNPGCCWPLCTWVKIPYPQRASQSPLKQTKMGGASTPTWDPIGFDNHSHLISTQKLAPKGPTQ